MKQLTLQEHYNLIKEGKGHKDMFLKAAKSQFPNIVPNAATFEQTSTLLKQRSIISENIWGIATGKTTQPDWFSIFNENVTAFKEDIGMFNDPMGYDKNAKSQMEVAREILEDAGLSKEEIEKFISDNMFKKGRLDDRAKEYVNNMINENYVASSQEEPVKNSDKKISKEVEEDQESNFDYKDPKNRDNVYGQEFLTGYYTEMKDPKNSEKTVDELLELVSKNLAKDRLHYVKDGQFGVKGLGYTEDAPGLGAGKEAKGKYKSSGYGDLKENKNPMFEGLGDGPLDKLFYKEYPKTKNEILKFLSKHKRGLSADEKSYYVDRYMKMIEKDLKESYEINKPKGPQNDAFNILLKKYSKDQIEKTWDKNYDDIKQHYNDLNKANRGSTNVAQELANFIDKRINENKNNMIKLIDLLEGEYYMPETKTPKKKEEPKKKVKKSPIADRVKEIEAESMFNAMEGKIQAMAEEIEMRENKLTMIDENEDLQEFINPVRIKEMQKEIDELKKTKEKMEKEYEKKSKGRKPKEVIDETETEEGY